MAYRWSRSGLLLACTMAVTHAMGGSLDPPAGPVSTNSAMYTLEAIYQRLDAGIAGSKRPTAFAEPADGPTPSTGHTLDEVMAKAPEADAEQGATANHVVQGKTFWCLQAGSWGLRTGAMTNHGSRNYMPGVADVDILAGHYDGSGSVTGDEDLLPGNIKKDVALFGATGTYEGDGSAYPAPVQSSVVWPNPRFVPGTGTNANSVVDNLTGLMWTKSAGLAGESLIWNDALAYCNDLSLDGYDDWRLPNLRELHSLCDFRRTHPALPRGHPFLNVSNNEYWSSTKKYGISTRYHWAVNMDDAGIEGGALVSLSCHVWPVRGGE